jgi:hypothetical protein
MAAKNQEMGGNYAEDDVSRKRIRKENGVRFNSTMIMILFINVSNEYP